METTMFEITVAIIMVSVIVVLLVWFRSTEAAASLRRRMGMIARVQIDPRITTGTNPKIREIMKDVRKRCAACMHEGYCERWLAGEVEGPNTFCPNASTFRSLGGTAG